MAPNKEAKGDFLLNCRLNSENNYTKYCEWLRTWEMLTSAEYGAKHKAADKLIKHSAVMSLLQTWATALLIHFQEEAHIVLKTKLVIYIYLWKHTHIYLHVIKKILNFEAQYTKKDAKPHAPAQWALYHEVFASLPHNGL